MSVAHAVAVAAVFVWVGMILAISFLEAPLKFRAPGITVRLGLGIGRLVFRALNACESVLAVLIAVALLVSPAATTATAALLVAGIALLAQLLIVRPRLSRRTDAVLAGETGSRSRAHVAYVGVEVAKLIALVVGGFALLTT